MYAVIHLMRNKKLKQVENLCIIIIIKKKKSNMSLLDAESYQKGSSHEAKVFKIASNAWLVLTESKSIIYYWL